VRKIFIIPFICTALASSCQKTPNSNIKIIGGHAATEHHPWFVQLLSEETSAEGFCGGTLIAPQIVVTAAHCIKPSDVKDLHVALGLADGENLHLNHPVKVRGIIVHPDYAATNTKNDIALLYLADYSGVVFEKPVAPLPFNRDSASPESDGVSVLAVGLGMLSPIGSLYDGVVREVTLPLIATAQCAETYEGLDSTQFCAGQWETGGIDTCNGDSGGPIVSQSSSGDWKLVGLTSHGDSCGQRGSPGVYTRLSAYAAWIDQSIEQLMRPRADEATAEDVSLLLKTHCVSEFGFIPLSTRDSDSQRRETVYSVNIDGISLTETTEIPSGKIVSRCEVVDNGKTIQAKLIRSSGSPESSGVNISIVATVDSKTYVSARQNLRYVQDTLLCDTELGHVDLVDQRNFTTVFIDNKPYNIGEATADPLPTEPLFGCSIGDASIEVFHEELQSDQSRPIAARIRHRSLGSITVKLVEDKPVTEAVPSLSWGGSNRGTFKFDNQSALDIFTWKLECSAPFSIELANGQTLTSVPSNQGTWAGVYIDSAIFSEGTIKAQSVLELTVNSLSQALPAAKYCKVNSSFWFDTSP
jgi:trypsin